MDMIRHRVSFYDLYPFDPRPLLNRIHHYLSLAPYSYFRLYFGIHTTWYLQSQSECANLLNRSTEISLL